MRKGEKDKLQKDIDRKMTALGALRKSHVKSKEIELRKIELEQEINDLIDRLHYRMQTEGVDE